LDSQNIQWKRNKNWFSYFFDSKNRFYTPDFYLPEHDTYIEIKGYKTEKDEVKWFQFGYKLIVLVKQEIESIKNNSYALIV